jgi:hypothetical protein
VSPGFTCHCTSSPVAMSAPSAGIRKSAMTRTCRGVRVGSALQPPRTRAEASATICATCGSAACSRWAA